MIRAEPQRALKTPSSAWCLSFWWWGGGRRVLTGELHERIYPLEEISWYRGKSPELSVEVEKRGQAISAEVLLGGEHV